MDINVLENEKNKLRIEIDSDIAFVNAVNENVWEQKGVKFSGYTKKHPYASKPEILVKSNDPKKTLEKALDQLISDSKDLKKKFEKQ